VVRGAVGPSCNLLPSYIDGGFGTLPFVSSVSYSQPAGSVPAIIGDSSGNISNITPQTLEVSYAYALPVDRGKWLLANPSGIVDKIIGARGHQFFPDRPAVPLYPSAKTHREWFNPAAFTAPPNFTYGTSGYNMLWGPHYQNWDMNLMKNITWKERYNLQLRADAFNVFNHPNFGVPSASISNPASMGVISSTVGEARTLEFAAKFSF
jgi:hypothetical protein